MAAIALFTEAPRFCPGCGTEITAKLARDQDWRAHCSHRCGHCGLHYQLVETQQALNAATASGGDLAQYVD